MTWTTRTRCGLLALALTGTASAQQTAPAFRSSTDGVVVDVTVRRGEASVTDLQASEFRVLDNGVPQDVHLASARDVPLDLWILTNNGGESDGSRARAHFPEQIRAVAALLRSGDRLAVLTLASPMQQILPLGPALPADVPDIPLHGVTTIAAGIVDALLIPGEAGRRHVIVAQMMGHDFISVIDPRRLPDLAQRSDAILDLAYSTSEPDRHDYLLDAAHVTGGTKFNAKDITDAVRQMLAALTHTYVLAYTATGVSSRGWHAITVTVTRAGKFTVAARRGYFVE